MLPRLLRLSVFGFYLQPAVGGRILSFDFWTKFAEIKNVYAIKVAAFNRYQTLDVLRAVCTFSRSNDIALYIGNDDNIVADLLTPYRFTLNGTQVENDLLVDSRNRLYGPGKQWNLSEIRNVLTIIMKALRSCWRKELKSRI
jgi:hypothetical protein